MTKRLALLILPLTLLAACTDRGYNAEPVSRDGREVDVPDVGDLEARRDQKCFKIEIWAGGFSTSYKDEGIACMVEPEGDK